MAIKPQPFNPNQRIDNHPFYSPQNYYFQTPQGPLVFGAGLNVNTQTGTVSVDPQPAASLGTVTSVTAGFGLETNPSGGIVRDGTVSLSKVSTVIPGTYSYPSVTVDGYGRITSISNGVTPLQGVTGLYPILVAGAAPSVTVSIAPASTSNAGAVQLADNLATPSSSLALTAYQGYLLQNQVNALSSIANLQFLAGTLNGSTGLIATVTAAGTAKGFLTGTVLPAATTANAGAIFMISVAGTFTPPGGAAQSVTPGDQYLSDGTSWIYFATGFSAPYATTSSPGIVRLATTVETQAFANNAVAVTPFGLAGLTSTTTQRGFVELATDAETLALGDTSRAVTPSNLSALAASTTQRGIVQLNDTLTSTSVTQAPTARALKEAYDTTIHTDIFQANGDLIVGLAAGQPRILPKGSDGQVLTADNTQALGMKWKTPVYPQSTPVGSMCWFTTDDATKVPVGWLVADGSSYSDATGSEQYPLFQVIGYAFTPVGAPSGTFAVPDLRGRFIRGWNDAGSNPTASTLDPSRVFGSCQSDAYTQHSHSITDPGHFHLITDLQHNHNVVDGGHTHGVTDPGHSHQWSVPNAEVVGDTPGFYDGNAKRPNVGAVSSVNSASVSIDNATTGITFDPAYTGITQTLVCTTAITVNNSPPTAFSPNETRPVNLVLIPLIKYKEV